MTIAHDIEHKIEMSLRDNLQITHLEVINESHHHIGHAGHDGGGESHFRILVVSDEFLGLSRVARHQKIYGILADLLKTKIHALAIEARISAEYQLIDDNFK